MAGQRGRFGEDMAFQRHSWHVERVAWSAMGVLAAAAALGLLSHGPLSRTYARGGDGAVTVAYERLERQQASSVFRVRAVAEKDAEIALRFGPAFLNTYEVRTVTPAPLRARSGAEGLEMVFAAAPSGEANVYMTGRARRFGLADFSVAVPGRPPAQVRQFVFP